MKHLKIAGLCLASMLVMGMALAGNASAAPLWLLCLPVNGTGLWKNSACTKLDDTRKSNWESSSILANTDKTVVLAMTLTLTDTTTPLGSTPVRCDHPSELGGSGFVGPNNLGRITEAEVIAPKTECRSLGGGCKAGEGEVRKVEGRNLPWQTAIFEVGGKFQTAIEGTVAGKEPGWLVECNTVLGVKADECVAESAAKAELVELANKKSGLEETELLVAGTFLMRHKADCTEGGVESGLVEGTLAILLANANDEPNGLGLSILGV
jgi:hypothetical protein